MKKRYIVGLIILIFIAYCGYTIAFPEQHDMEFKGLDIHIETNNLNVSTNTSSSLEFVDSSSRTFYQYDVFDTLEEAKNYSAEFNGVIYKSDDGKYIVGWDTSYKDNDDVATHSPELIKSITNGTIVN
jgi:hypothetical protein